MPNEMDGPSRMDLLDEKIHLVKSLGFLTCVVLDDWCLSVELATWRLSINLATWCLSKGLDDWCLIAELVAWRLSVGLAAWRMSYTIQDFSIIVNIWHQSTALTWYDCQTIRAVITAWQSTQSSLQDKRQCNQLYINPSKSTNKVRMHIRSSSSTKIVRVILVWLKLRRGMLKPLVRTSFCVGKKFV